MSRVGKKAIAIPSGVKVKIDEGSVLIEGPKGSLRTEVPAGIKFELKEGHLFAVRENDEKSLAAKHGLVRTLVANAVEGVTKGFTRELDILGIGYKAEVRRNAVTFSLGYSHPIEFPLPPGIQAKVEKLTKPQLQHYQTTILLSGIDKYVVGQTAANMRFLRRPDRYKGKGIRYAGEQIKLKEGKKGA